MVERQLAEAANIIENLIKDEIIRQGLIDSGTLLDSVKCNYTINDGVISFSVIAEDYFQYLDERYNITSNAFSNAEYDRALTLMADATSLLIIEDLNKTI
jgi:phosphorylcholine metabolism protein LicD